LGLLEDGNVGVSILPEGEEVFVGGKRTRASSIRIGTTLRFRLQGVCARHSKTRQGPVQQFQTMPLWSMIFWNSLAASAPCPAAK